MISAFSGVKKGVAMLVFTKHEKFIIFLIGVGIERSCSESSFRSILSRVQRWTSIQVYTTAKLGHLVLKLVSFCKTT